MTIEEAKSSKNLVNPVAVQGCRVRIGELLADVLDVSFIRLVVSLPEGWAETAPGTEVNVEFALDRNQFTVPMVFQSRGEDWLRLSFAKIVPSAAAHLRSFLSPKRVGESIREDWRSDLIRHYHGLNESELWFDQNGRILFSYLDSLDSASQFVICVPESKGPLRVGKIARTDYIELSNLDQDLPLSMMTDRETYGKLGECRDVVTNFRPSGQLEYNLKQRLLKVISDHLYSASRKVEMMQPRSAPVRSPSVEA